MKIKLNALQSPIIGNRIHCMLLFALALSPLAGATTYYVSVNDGSDTNSGLSWAEAKASIQAGIDAASDGDEVLVAEGHYVLSQSINLNKGVSVIAAGLKSLTVVDGDQKDRCLIINHDNALFTGFRIERGKLLNVENYAGAWGYFGCGIYLRKGVVSNCEIRDCTCRVYTQGIFIKGLGVMMEGGILRGCDVGPLNFYVSYSGCLKDGGGVYMSGDAVVENCVIHDVSLKPISKGGGIYMNGGKLRSCTLVGNAAISGQALYLTGDAYVANSIIWGNADGSDIVLSEVSNSNCISYSCVEENLAGLGNITSDPLFVSSTDFRLQAGSPCIDVAYAPTSPQFDIEGKGRTRPDMGAYEYGEGNDLITSGYVINSAPEVSIVSMSNRVHRNVIDLSYTVTDAEGDICEVRGYATPVPVDQQTRYWDEIYVISNFVDGTESEFGAGIVPTNISRNVGWDTTYAIQHAVEGLRVRLMANDSDGLPIDLHFVDIPADTNAPALSVSRYAGVTPESQLQQALVWAVAGGDAKADGQNLLAVGGAYSGQAVALNGILTAVGPAWLAELMPGVRIATSNETIRAREASTPGSVTRWPSYYWPERFFNEYGIETTETNSWYFIKE